MANVNRPRGFVPLRMRHGCPYVGSIQAFVIPASDGTAVFIGDPVKLSGDCAPAGTLISGVDAEGMAYVIRDTSATTGQDTVGVVVGFVPTPTMVQTGVKHRAASTAVIVLCETNLANVVFEIQEDALVTPVAAASMWLNAAYVATAGSATTGLSGVVLDSDSVNTTVTLPLKIIGLVKRPDNALNTGGAGTDQAKFEVVWNTHAWAPNIVGVA